MNRGEVLAGVQECLAKVLGLPVESIREESRIIYDLGADSLDFLDLSFQLQQKFGVAFSPRDDERRLRERMGGNAVEVDGVYTAEALEALRRSMPEVPAEELSDGLTAASLPFVFRVATVVNLVLRLKEEGDA